MWKTTNDGEDWVDETGDLVTISMGQGVWFEKDYYQVTAGEGVLVKRGLDGGEAEAAPRVPRSTVQ